MDIETRRKKQQALMIQAVERQVRSRARQLYESRGQAEGEGRVRVGVRTIGGKLHLGDIGVCLLEWLFNLCFHLLAIKACETEGAGGRLLLDIISIF